MNGFGLGRFRGLGRGYQFDPRQKFAQQLMTAGSRVSPVQHWAQGLGRMGQMLLGVKLQQQIEEGLQGQMTAKERAIRELFQEEIVDQAAYTQPGGPLPSNIPEAGPENLRPFGERYFDEQVPNTATFTPRERLTLGNDQGMTTQAQDIATNIQGGPNSLQGPDPFPFGQDKLSTGGLQQSINLPPQAPDSVEYGADTQVPEQTHMALSRLGKALIESNQGQRGGIDPNIFTQFAMAQDKRGYEAGLAKTKREQQLSDRDALFQQQRDLKGIIPGQAPKMTTRIAPGGLEEEGYYDPTTRQWVGTGNTFDPNIKSPAAQKQSIDRAKATQPQWSVTTAPGGEQVQVSSTGERKPIPPIVLTPGEKKIDQDFSKFYSEYYAQGRMADVYKGLEAMEGVEERLNKIASGESDENLTGPWLGLEPDVAKSFTHPESLAVQEDVANIIQRNLRPMLGAQFTEKEGRDLIKRAYNPSLEEAENAKRINRLVASMRFAAEQKDKAAKYYEKHGTLKGFKGTAEFTMQDYYDAIEGKDSKVMPSKQRKRRVGEDIPTPPPGFEVQ